MYPGPSIHSHKDQFVVVVQLTILDGDVHSARIPFINLKRDLGQGSVLVSIDKDLIQGATCQVREQAAGDDDGIVLAG